MRIKTKCMDIGFHNKWTLVYYNMLDAEYYSLIK